MSEMEHLIHMLICGSALLLLWITWVYFTGRYFHYLHIIDINSFFSVFMKNTFLVQVTDISQMWPNCGLSVMLLWTQ